MSLLSFLRAIFRHESWESRLYTPTMIQKIDDTYFISDCWHNRIIYSKKISAPISRWKSLSDEVFGGHTISYNGNFVLADNTDKDLIFVWQRQKILNGGGYECIDVKKYLPSELKMRNGFNLVRPHFILHDESEDVFVTTLSWANGLLLLHGENEKLQVDDVVFPKISSNSYLKFVNKFDDLIWIAEENDWVAFSLKDKKLSEEKRLPIPAELRNQNFIAKIGKKYIVTCWGKGQIFSANSIEDFSSGNYRNVNDFFNLKGTPYFITEFDGFYWITDIVEHSGIYRFSVDEFGELKNIEAIFDFGKPTERDEIRKRINPVLR